jgi:Tol biopolymer transport system component
MAVPDGLRDALADRYALERELGRGGMATVYLAQDLKHHRQVAVKVLRAEIAASLGADRFSREIEVAARLQHPHILPLLDSGEAAGFLYYVMPFVEGESLRERLSHKGELPVHDALRVIIEVVDALAHAHSHGVVHRDVKPDNIMLSGRHALVMDFGVAKAVSEASGRNQLTTAGVALGTPAYMAPEQAAADPHLDHRVDIYAVGALGYELLTGRPPFIGRTPQEVLAAHVTQSPDPVERYRPGLSPAISQVIMRCLAKRPADRWQDAEELLRELEPLATPSGGMTPTQTRPVEAVVRSRRKVLVPVLAVAGLAALAAILVLTFRKTEDLPAIGRQWQLTRDPGLEIEAAISPDGKFIAYVVNEGDAHRIMVRQVEGGEPVMIDPVRSNLQTAPQWSPDGNRLLFLSRRGIEVIPPLGGQSRVVIPAIPRTVLFPGSWSPSGDEFAYARGDSVLIGNMEGASRVLTVTLQPHSLSWSPDGRLIAYVSGNRESRTPGQGYGNTATSIIQVIASEGGTPVNTVEQGTNLSPVWHGSNTLLYISDRDGSKDIYTLPVNGSGLPAGKPTRLTTGLNAVLLSLSADGSRAVYTVFRDRSNIWSLPNSRNAILSIAQATPVTRGNQIIERFSVSSDRKLVVFDSDQGGGSDLYLLNMETGDVEPLTPDSTVEFSPSWSPNGREIAYHAIVDGRRQIFVLGENGPPVQVTHGLDDQRIPRWDSSGQRIYMGTNVTTAPSASFVDRQPDSSWSEPRRLPFIAGAASPDGRFFYGAGTLLSTAGDTLSEDFIPPGIPRVREPVWLADGSRLYFLAANASDQIAGIWSVDPLTGVARQHARFDDPSRPWHRYGFQPFADRLYLTLGERESDIWAAEIQLGSGQ